MCILSFKGRQVGDDLIAEPQTQWLGISEIFDFVCVNFLIVGEVHDFKNFSFFVFFFFLYLLVDLN